MPESILVVDDETGVRTSLAGILGDEAYEVEAVGSGEECLAAVAARRFDLVILDVWLPGADGLETLARLRETDPELPVVMISGHGTIETAVRAVRLGARDFVEKPLSLEKTLLVVRNALSQRRLEAEVRTLKRKLDQRYEMVGESPALQALRAEIARAAPSNGRALIFGENGTGKELVARAIHNQSRRARGPFVEVNCAAIPEELIESELFGHTKGAFTGALAARKGKFELADGGTLFLDEIADMSLKTQAKVLRALQEQRIEPVGGAGSVAVDVRVIVATNKNLEEEIRRGTFRDDLYFRLNVIPFRVPPLRERREDVPLLARHFVEMLSAEHGRRPKSLTPEALDVLARLPWPGNVRELRNIIERLVIMAPGKQIEARDLPASLLEGLPADVASAAASLESAPLAVAREEFERQFILRRYRQCGGNMSRTAEALGVERSNLYRKMKAYGLLPVRREEA
ncbi:MAG: sigma-54 dependent transcriptional regulator [Acidobacteria bacterium]|jgi:two-component system nitrogen regulation response regulator NtrX|nr:sigma-54 dependent transcriptional regulator [Acidobacteriota bacterium]